MKKYFLGGGMLLMSVILSFGQTTDQQIVENLARKKFQWMTRQRFDSLEAILDDRLKYIHSNGWVQSKQDVIADLKSGKLAMEQIDIHDLEVRVYEGVAIVTGRGKFSGNVNKTPFAIDLMFTEVYVRKNNN